MMPSSPLRLCIPGGEMIPRLYTQQVLFRFLTPVVTRHAFHRDQMRTYPLSAGTVVLPLRNVEQWGGLNIDTEVLHMPLRDEIVAAVALDILPRAAASIQPATQLNDPRVGGVLSAMEHESALGFPAGRIFMDAMEYALIRLLLTLGHAPRLARGGLPPSAKRRVVDYIEARLETALGLQELAVIAELSVSHFTAMFRISFGLSPHQFVLRHRVQRAKHLLGDRRSGLLDIALGCGFASQQHLARVFKRITGMRPTDYRRAL